MGNKTLLLLTVSFPYGNAETFLETEIKYHTEVFESVIIVPLRKENHILRELPINCIVLDVSFLSLIKKGCTALYRGFSLILKELKSAPYLIFCPFVFFRSLCIALFTGLWIPYVSTIIKDFKVDMIYSYWCNYGALIGIEASAHKINVVCRAHGYDLYDYRHRAHYIPFYKYIIQNIDFIYPVSNDGVKYLHKKYPQYKAKILLARLGVKNSSISESSKDGIFRIVSCSSLIPLKRVALLARALCRLYEKIEWVHFGDGPERDKIEKILKDKHQNLSVRLFGNMPNDFVLDFYKNNPVDIFINVSQTEGIPVSIMEAMSFSIPVIAPKIGGIPEILNDLNGFLTDANIDDIQLSYILLNIIRNIDLSKYRVQAHITWETYYNADVTYHNFVRNLCNLAFEKE